MSSMLKAIYEARPLKVNIDMYYIVSDDQLHVPPLALLGLRKNLQ